MGEGGGGGGELEIYKAITFYHVLFETYKLSVKTLLVLVVKGSYTAILKDLKKAVIEPLPAVRELGKVNGRLDGISVSVRSINF